MFVWVSELLLEKGASDTSHLTDGTTKTQHTPILRLSLTVVRLAADKTRDTTDPDMVTQELIDSVLTRELAKTSARKSKVSKSR